MDWTSPIDSGPAPETDSEFDVIVVGGGPGGAAAAGYSVMAGKKVLLIEKAIWPRDKPCGDAVGGKSLLHVAELGVKTRLEETPHFRVTGITFTSTNGNSVNVPLPKEEIEAQEAGYSLPREQFDWLMFERANELVLESGGSVIQGFRVTDIDHAGLDSVVDPGPGSGDARRVIGVSGFGKDGDGNKLELSFRAPLTIGAGGCQCPVSRSIVLDTYAEALVHKEHYCGAFRQYWRGVEGCGYDEGDIEIHFIDEVNPGYFWIFPVSQGVVNVGIGMVISEMDKRSAKLKALQNWVITESERFASRFANAELLPQSSKGWLLPFGSPRKHAPGGQPRRAAMAGAALIGDAASLIDPFTGEGIGNALVSAKMIVNLFDAGEGGSNGFSLDQAQDYQTALWNELGPELTNSFKLQKMMRKKWLMNWFVSKAAKKSEIRRILTDMLATKEAQGELHSKWFMFKTLFL